LHSPRQSAPKRSWRSKAGTFIIACVGNDNDLREVVPEEDGAVSSNLRCSDASIRLQVAAQPERFFDRLDKTASMKPIRPEENGILLRCTRNRRGV
jgi:hypothetical protein